MTAEDVGMFGLIGAGISFFVGCTAAFLTHLWWIIHLLMSVDAIPGGKVVLAFFGVFFLPLGCLHGVYLWFNQW